MGSGEFGQLGTGFLQNEVLPKRLDLYSKIEKISAGESHTLLLTENGKIYAAGSNSTGQLGIGSRKSSLVFVKVSTTENLRFKKVAAGTFSAAFCAKGDLYLWGTGSFGEYLTPKRIGEFKHPLKRLSVGTNFACCIDSKGNVYSWGSNTHGELGTGTLEPKSFPQQILSLQGKRITSVSCGRNFVLALGNTINNSYSAEKSRDLGVAFENESKRMTENERSAKRAERSVDYSLHNISSHQSGGKYYMYKERNSEMLDKSVSEDQNRSVDARERLSVSLCQSQKSAKKSTANRPQSALAKNQRVVANRNEINANRPSAKKVMGRAPQRNSVQRENNFDRQRGLEGSGRKSPKRINRASQDRSTGKYRSVSQDKQGGRTLDASPNKSYSRDRDRSMMDHSRSRNISQDSLIDEAQLSKNLQTASFEDLHSSDIYRKNSRKENVDIKAEWRNNRLSNEKATSEESKSRFTQNSVDRNSTKAEPTGYSQGRMGNQQQSSLRSDAHYQDPRHEMKLRIYEETIRENNKEILGLQENITDLKRQLYESESKIRSLMLQEKLHGSKLSMEGTGESWKDLQQVNLNCYFISY